MNTSYPWIKQSYSIYHAQQFPGETNPLTYFSLTDALIHHAANTEEPMLYFWPTEKLVFLGMIDTKMPYIEDALEVLKDHNYRYVSRNSGGLAVVSDPGILNFSMIFPEEGKQRLKINDAYERMHALVSETFKDYNIDIQAKEIPNSYCPGDYDLSINGRKIAGISQRRVKGGSAIMIYIGINGDQDERSYLIKDFYDQGIKGQEVKWDYPDIDPKVMTTVSQELGFEISVDQVIDLIIQVFERHGQVKQGPYTEDIIVNYQDEYKKMIRRNQKLLGPLFKEGVDEGWILKHLKKATG